MLKYGMFYQLNFHFVKSESYFKMLVKGKPYHVKMFNINI